MVSSPSVSVNGSSDRSFRSLQAGALPVPQGSVLHVVQSQHLFDLHEAESLHAVRLFHACSMTSCDLLLASFGASSSTVRFHPLSVLSNGITLPVSILYANTRSRPETDPLSLLCHGFDSHQRSSNLCFLRFNGDWFAFCIFGQANVDPHPRLASCRVRQLQLPRLQ